MALVPGNAYIYIQRALASMVTECMCKWVNADLPTWIRIPRDLVTDIPLQLPISTSIFVHFHELELYNRHWCLFAAITRRQRVSEQRHSSEACILASDRSVYGAMWEVMEILWALWLLWKTEWNGDISPLQVLCKEESFSIATWHAVWYQGDSFM